ncbi:MAG: hypothetical protein RLZZ301_1755 [Bacteroidota bacterium]|jgi:16S rRNA (uracil1498-N3)-methyltransferase
MRLFYAPDFSAEQQQYQLSEEESKHCVRVLRMQEGDVLTLLNGNGLEAIARITAAHAKHCHLQIEKTILHPETPLVHVAMAPTKNMDRIEWFLEKATELGLRQLSFLACQHNERNKLNLERLHKIAVAAMKQSKRYYLPVIEELKPFESFVRLHPNGYIGHCYEGSKISTDNLRALSPFLIGPEGDFSEKEVELALASGYQAVHLSDYRLRTETAALAAVFHLL